MAQNIKFIRRGGIYPARRRVSEANRHAAAALRPENPPAEPGAATNRADMESAPTGVCGIAGSAFSRVATGLAPVRRGGIYPARGRSRRRNVRGTMRASSPTEVCGVVKFVVSRVATGPARFVGEGHGPPAGPYTATFSRLVSMFSPFRRAGVYARRTLANSKMEGLRHCRGRVFPVGHEPCPVRRGGIYPARGVCAAAWSGGVRAPRPTVARAAAAVPFGLNIKFIRRGGIYCARRRSRRREAPGTMQASSPTEVCYNAGSRFPG